MMKNNQVDLIVTPLRSAMLAGHANKVHVLVRVQAPDLPENKKQARQPYGIGFVIDRSGSMAGVPLKEAVRCVRFMSDKLTDRDFASLVTFDNNVALDFPLSQMTERSDLNEALAEVTAGGQTNLHGGWREAAEEFVRKEANTALKRVVLLSDGCVNNGVVNPASITRQVAKFASEGITTSTYGLGSHFNEELMIDIAKAGQGNHYYAETADDLLESFNEEFELMSNLWAKGLHIKVRDDMDVRVKLLNDYLKVDALSKTWELPNLAYGSEAWAMFELTVSGDLREGDVADLFSISVSGEDIDGRDVLVRSELLSLPVVNAVAFAAIAEDELVRRRLDELQAADYLKRARRAVQVGDWDEADYILNEAKRLFSNSPWAQDVLRAMSKLATKRDERMFMKEASFSSSKMSTRLSSKHEDSALLMESSIPAFLRRKSAQGKAQFFDDDKDPL
jgi:Ca-activated chloride channel family protein